jgi:hypothetical protein
MHRDYQSYRKPRQRLAWKIQVFEPKQAGNGRTKVDVLDGTLYHVG